MPSNELRCEQNHGRGCAATERAPVYDRWVKGKTGATRVRWEPCLCRGRLCPTRPGAARSLALRHRSWLAAAKRARGTVRGAPHIGKPSARPPQLVHRRQARHAGQTPSQRSAESRHRGVSQGPPLPELRFGPSVPPANSEVPNRPGRARPEAGPAYMATPSCASPSILRARRCKLLSEIAEHQGRPARNATRAAGCTANAALRCAGRCAPPRPHRPPARPPGRAAEKPAARLAARPRNRPADLGVTHRAKADAGAI